MKMKIFLIVIVVFLFCSLLMLIRLLLQNRRPEKQGKVCFKSYCFDVELAITSWEKSSGLMFREKLDPQTGIESLICPLISLTNPSYSECGRI